MRVLTEMNAPSLAARAAEAHDLIPDMIAILSWVKDLIKSQDDDMDLDDTINMIHEGNGKLFRIEALLEALERLK